MIGILLAVYNGMPYLPELVASLQGQSESDWQLLVRDDGSQDGSLLYLRQLAAADRRVHLLEDRLGRLGVAGNFGALLRAGLERNYEFFFWCDQDDVWHRDKVQQSLHKIREYPADVPLLVHCDLRVINAGGTLLCPSIVDYCRHRLPGGLNRRTLMVQNYVTGCSSVLNRAAAQLVNPIPGQVLMHDHWCALLVAWAGELIFLPEALVDYRLHSGNVIGVTTPSQRLLLFWRRFPRSFAEKIRQVKQTLGQDGLAFGRLRERQVGGQDLKPLWEFATLGQVGLRERLARFWRWPIPWCRGLGKWAFLATLPWLSEGPADDRRSSPPGSSGGPAHSPVQGGPDPPGKPSDA